MFTSSRHCSNLTLLQAVSVRPEAPPSELAVAVARHFEGMEVDEEECIGGFLERLEKGTGPTEYARKTCYFDGRAPQPPVRKRKRTKMAARPLEQVGSIPAAADHTVLQVLDQSHKNIYCTL